MRSLRQELAGLKMKLDAYQEQRAQDLESVEQLLKEFEVLQRDDEQLHATNLSLENTVAELNEEINVLRSAVNKYKTAEAQYKSTIHGLEDEVRHLRHVNNRLHGQATHYSLSSSDNKSTPHEPGSTPSRPRSSPHYHAQTPPSATPPRTEPTSSAQRLTRRKWLEPSEPGLIFGNEPQQKEDTENQVPQSKTKLRSPSYVGLEERRPSVQDAVQSDKGGVSATADLAESSLRSIRSGNILAADSNKAHKKTKAGPISTEKYSGDMTSLEKCVERNLQVVANAEQKMAELQKEREQLQSALQRVPRSGRTTLHEKQDQLHMEARLDEVDKEIGAIRMTLKSHHAL